MVEKIIKSKKRVKELAEVYTKNEVVNNILNLLSNDCFNIDKSFLEPSCGNGNFIEVIIDRKINQIKIDNDFEIKVLISVSRVFGVDINNENILECRERIFNFIINKHNFSNSFKKALRDILNKNYIVGNTLNPNNIIFIQYIWIREYTFMRSYFTYKNILDRYNIPFYFDEIKF